MCEPSFIIYSYVVFRGVPDVPWSGQSVVCVDPHFLSNVHRLKLLREAHFTS